MRKDATFRLAPFQAGSIHFDFKAASEKAYRPVPEGAGKSVDVIAFDEIWRPAKGVALATLAWVYPAPISPQYIEQRTPTDLYYD